MWPGVAMARSSIPGSDRHRLARVDRPVRNLEAGATRREEGRTVGRELGAAGDVVGVGVGVRGPRDRPGAFGGEVALAVREAGGVDDERGAVSECDHV